ncbi:MAG: Holliday junction resolvase RuvX [Bacteroidales bacterium]|nr:Holliday junction resolvase RuvX [Bacteroidales bacterium]
MKRIIALDYGNKRVGVAVTDPLQLFASPLQTVATSEIFTFLNDYFGKEPVDVIVIGYPKKMNNQPSESVIYINPFIKKLEKTYPAKKIILTDERFSSKIAFQTMIDGGLKKKQRQDKAMVDKISAAIILQSYLDATNK